MYKKNKLSTQYPVSLWLALFLIAFLLLRGLGNDSLGYPDADRILMDGVFVHDFLRDMPLLHIYDYTIHYFAQYPALSIGYRPPFFPLIEAIFNGTLGVTMSSSRLALVAFVLLGAVAWYRLVCRIFDANTALLSLLLYATTPFVVQWGWYTMAELPVLSMSLMTAYYYYRYTETDQARYFYAMSILFVLTVWTKQTAVFIAIWFVLYALFNGQLIAYLKRKEVWLGLLLMLVLLTPLAMITLWLGKKNISQSIGGAGGKVVSAHYIWHVLSFYFKKLYFKQLTQPVFFFSMLGMGLSVFYRDKRVHYFFLGILSTYVFFTYLNARDARYTLFWLPAFCLFAALPFYYLKKYPWPRYILSALLVLTLSYQLYRVTEKSAMYATGYDVAAQYVLEHSLVPMVFFDGFNNGYFTYFMRTLDAQHRYFVLRGDKLLSSSSVFSKSSQAVHAHNTEDFRKVLVQYGVDLVVAESRNEVGIAIHDDFRAYLKTSDFELLTAIPVDSNRSQLKNQQLLIYRFLQRQPLSADYLELHLPIVGQVLKVPMR
ncbi:MAG: glycosyltransferase [Methyloprofundus sp.]|nr:glycosyltransferase [Methyloprofundus sp.]